MWAYGAEAADYEHSIFLELQIILTKVTELDNESLPPYYFDKHLKKRLKHRQAILKRVTAPLKYSEFDRTVMD